jgi:hypothetical protein
MVPRVAIPRAFSVHSNSGLDEVWLLTFDLFLDNDEALIASSTVWDPEGAATFSGIAFSGWPRDPAVMPARATNLTRLIHKRPR